MRYLMIILASVFLSATTYAEDTGIQFETHDWPAILQKAKKENKLIFLDAYTSWCGPCKWMSKNVFTDAEVAAFYNSNFINAKFDMEKNEGVDLAKKYGVNVYPSLIWINGDGEVVHRMCGARENDVFMMAGKTALDNTKNLRYYTKLVKAGNVTPEVEYEYLAMMSEACQDYTAEMKQYLEGKPTSELSQEGNWRIIADFGVPYKSPVFQYVLNNRKEFDSKYGKDNVDKALKDMLQVESQMLMRNYSKDPKAFDDFLVAVQKMPVAGIQVVAAYGEVELALAKHDWEKLYKAGLVLEKYAEEVDAQAWNKIAWTMYEEVDDKTKLQAALRWIDLGLTHVNLSYMLDTKAALLIKLGNKTEAVKVAEEALAAAKNEGQDIAIYEERLAEAKAMQ